MAISASLELAAAINISGGGGGAQTAGSMAATTGDVYVAFVHANMWDDTTGLPTSITGPGGLAFDLRGQTAVIDGYSKHSVWTAKATSSASGNVTVTAPGGQAWDGYVIHVVKLTGAKVSGTNGADCIKSGQIASAVGAKPLTATLASAITSGNRGLAFGGSYNNSSTPETCASSDYSTELADGGVALDSGTYSMYGASYLSADASDNSPTLSWTGTAAGAYGVLVVEIDAEPSGTNLTGQSLSIGSSTGALTVASEYALGGRQANVAISAGSLGMLHPDSLGGRFLSIVAAVGGFDLQVAQSVPGRSAGLSAAAGVPSVTADGITLNPQTASIGMAVGSLGSGGELTGRQLSIAAVAGALGPSVPWALGGHALGIQAVAGSVANGTSLESEALSIAAVAGALGVSDAQGLGSQTLSIAAVAGALGTGGGGPNPTGQSLSISGVAGTLGAGGAPPLPGQALSIATVAGDLGEEGSRSLEGQTLSIARAHGAFQAPETSTALNGAQLSISASHGAVAGPDGAMVGRALGIQAVAGALGSAATAALPGRTLGIQTVPGALGSSSDPPLPGRALSIVAVAGALGSSGPQVLPGQTLSIATVAGSVGAGSNPTPAGRTLGIQTVAGQIDPTTPIGGFAIGISMSHGQLGSDGSTSTDTLFSAPVTIGTATGSLVATAQENMPSLYSTIGANELPLNPAARNGKGVYTVADVGLVVLLDLFEAAIKAECGAMYEAVLGDPNCVHVKIPFDLLEWDNLDVFEYPALAGHSQGHAGYQIEIGLDVKPSTYTLRYILPVLSSKQHRQLNGFLNGVENAIRATVAAGYHPDFQNGFQALIGEKSFAKFKSIQFLETKRGRLQFATDIHQFVLEMRINVEEVIGPNPRLLETLVPFRGLDGTINVDDETSLTKVEFSQNFS